MHLDRWAHAPNDCKEFRWTAAPGAELLADPGWLLGLADDGTALVAVEVDGPENVAAMLVQPDGTRTRVPLGVAARLSAGGRLVSSRACRARIAGRRRASPGSGPTARRATPWT